MKLQYQLIHIVIYFHETPVLRTIKAIKLDRASLPLSVHA